jgi:septum site-determining protein MinD
VPLGLADGILLVTTPDDVAVNDTVKTADLADRVDGEVIGTLITRVTRNTDVPAIAEAFEMPILGVIPDDSEAAGEEPMVYNAGDSDAAEAYRQLADSLARVFFDGAAGSDLDRIFEESWFVDAEEEDSDDEEDGGVFGGLFG